MGRGSQGILAKERAGLCLSGRWDRELVWWAGGRRSNRPVTVRVVNGTPKLLG